MKLKVDKLKVKSFVTSLEDNAIKNQVRGGFSAGCVVSIDIICLGPPSGPNDTVITDGFQVPSKPKFVP